MADQSAWRRIVRCAVLIGALLVGISPSGVHSATLTQTETIYALPGTLELATGQPFLTYFVTVGGTKYAIFGSTPDIEDDIMRIRDRGADVPVKVWGTLNQQGEQYPGPEIIATAVREVSAESPTATPQATATPIPTSAPPVAIGRFEFVNLHVDPNQSTPVTGQIVLGQECPVTGRDANAGWLRLDCGDDEGWVASTVVTLQGNLASIEVVGPGSQVSQIPVVLGGQPTSTPAPSDQDWKINYYSNRNLQGNPALQQSASRIAFDWGTGSPGPEVPADNFSASFERVIDFVPGQYRMCVCDLDDGARLWIDNVLVLNDWVEGPSRDLIVDRRLSGPTLIRIEYFEATNMASISFTYAGNDASAEEWQASYWNNTTLDGLAVMTRTEPRTNASFVIDYEWGTGSPASGVINSDLFSARWEGSFYFNAGSYVFNAYSDDGMRVWVDGTLVLYGWNDGYEELHSGVYGIGQGHHTVRVEYYERTGNALVRLRWYVDQPMLVQ
ncbi:MAG: PA14 domain-containing protein [Caldilineaceae bacterium]